MAPRVLIVERSTVALPLAESLRAAGARCFTATTRDEAVEVLLTSSGLDLVLVGSRVDLSDAHKVSHGIKGDGTPPLFDHEGGLELARLATLMLPTPRVFGLADVLTTVHDAHALGAMGVQALLDLPTNGAVVLKALERIERDSPPPVYALLARYVGHVSLLAFEREVRRALLLQALERSRGSRSGAARLLRTSRQMVQKVVNAEE